MVVFAILSSSMPQGSGPHKKSTQGFGSNKYAPEKKRAAQSRGGKAKVPKGFAQMSPERRREVARKGGLA
jgi:Stress-induced bacterial acidophilic repeat motif